MKGPTNEKQMLEAVKNFMLRNAKDDEVCHKIGISTTKLNKLRTLVIESYKESKLKAKEERILQATMMEEELFNAIINKVDEDIIDELQLSYVQFCALNY